MYVSDTTAAGRANLVEGTSGGAYGLRRELLEQLCTMMEVNPYAQVFMSAHEYIALNRDIKYCALRFVQPVSSDRRQFSLPTAHEVGMIVCSMDQPTFTPAQRNIALHVRATGALEQVNELFPVYLPLHYVLILPFGTQGWRTGLPFGPFQGWSVDASPGSRRANNGLLCE